MVGLEGAHIPHVSTDLQLLLVDVVLLRVATPKEQVHLAHLLALLPVPQSLVEEATEGGKAGAGSDHDHGRLQTMGQAQGGLADKHGGVGLLGKFGQVVGAQAADEPMANLVAKDHRSDRHPRGIHSGRGGDAVVASLEPGQQLQQQVQRGFAGGKVPQHIHNAATIFDDERAVLALKSAKAKAAKANCESHPPILPPMPCSAA